MNAQKELQLSRYRSIQILLALFSFVFFAIISYGYYHLLIDSGWFIAMVGGAIIALVAWFLGRWIGTTPGGPWTSRANPFLMLILLAVSAAGVFNTMMVYMEGEQILVDTTTESQVKFTMLETAASSQLKASGAEEKLATINGLRDALVSEIRSPGNTGEGQAARQIMETLRRELPGFIPLSGSGRSDDQDEEVIADYNQRIDALIAGAPWNNANLVGVTTVARDEAAKLEKIRTDIATSYSPERLRQYVSVFLTSDGVYRKAFGDLAKDVKVEGIAPSLPIESAQYLGNVYKILPLFINRLGQGSWMYLLLALAFDFLLVQLFAIAAENRIQPWRPSWGSAQ